MLSVSYLRKIVHHVLDRLLGHARIFKHGVNDKTRDVEDRQ